MPDRVETCVLISAGAEWRALIPHFPRAQLETTPYGECLTTPIKGHTLAFLHGGWGKVASAGSTQYAIDRWAPRWLLNLGTCGGVEGQVSLFDTILAEKTVIYDIIEGMTSYEGAIEHYAVQADLDWLGDELPFQAKRCTLYSADRDIRPKDVSGILKRFGAVAADWESGAFAWVCARNGKDWLVLRTVSDLVSAQEGEALGNVDLWKQRTAQVMESLLNTLPWLIERYLQTHL
ncbi:MAG: hypothetical protein ACNA70_03005 [Brevefilum sp.]